MLFRSRPTPDLRTQRPGGMPNTPTPNPNTRTSRPGGGLLAQTQSYGTPREATGGSGLLQPQQGTGTTSDPQAITAANPFGAGQNVRINPQYVDSYNKFMNGGFPEITGKAREGYITALRQALSPSASPTQALQHGGANAGYQQDSHGNYMAGGTPYGYGTSTPGTPNQVGVFTTSDGQYPPPGPNGEVAFRVGPGQYQYMRLSNGAKPTFGGG